jgi:hypothetical protein
VTVTAPSLAVLKSSENRLAFRPVVIDVDGTLTIGDTLRTEAAPRGQPVTVDWIDQAGHVEKLDATLVRVTHIPGGIIYVPELANPPAMIRVPGYGTAWLGQSPNP